MLLARQREAVGALPLAIAQWCGRCLQLEDTDIHRHIDTLAVEVGHIHIHAVRYRSVETFSDAQFDTDALVADAQARVVALCFATDVRDAHFHFDVEDGFRTTGELIIRFGHKLHCELSLRIAHGFSLCHLRALPPRQPAPVVPTAPPWHTCVAFRGPLHFGTVQWNARVAFRQAGHADFLPQLRLACDRIEKHLERGPLVLLHLDVLRAVCFA